MDPAAEGNYEAPAMRCHACAEQARAATAWADGNGSSDGLYFAARRLPPT